MLTISISNFSVIVDIFLQLFNFIKSINLWTSLNYGIIILSLIGLMASRSTDKNLKGLQGTASATVITRGAIDAYEAWKSSNSNDEDDSENKKEDKKEDKKEEVKTENKTNEDNNNKTNEK